MFAGHAAIVLALAAGLPSPEVETLSRRPVDVVLDYCYHTGHLHNGAGGPLYPLNEAYWNNFLVELRKSPPEVLIVGKEGPLVHSLGAIASYGGENQTFPQIERRDGRGRITADQLEQRFRAVRKFTGEVHRAGVPVVAPYVSLITLFGEPEARIGFWEFLDHWDEYAGRFALGPRPDGDPLDWCQRDPQGNVYFKWGPDKPHYKPLRRYSLCANQPGWRQWLHAVTRTIAQSGYDGLWIDNAVEQRCYCQRCRAEAGRLGVSLNPPSASVAANRQTQRVWLQSHLRLWDELRATGVRERTGFGIYVNYIEIPHNREVTDHAELCMIEHCWLGAARLLWPGGIWSGSYPAMPELKVLHNRTAVSPEARVFDNLWALQLSFAMRGGRGVHWLYGGPAANEPQFEHNFDSALLALGEAAAFGGGAAVHVAGQNAFTGPASVAANKARHVFFREFLPRVADLYDGLRPAGQFAVVVHPDQATEGLLEAQMVHEALLWRGLAVDVLNGESLDAPRCAQYARVILPGAPELPAALRRLEMLRSGDTIRREDVRAVTEAYQHRRPIPPLRRTQLVEQASRLAEQLRPTVELPAGARVQAAVWARHDLTVLHLVNFQVPIGRGNEGRVKPLRGLKIGLELSSGKTVRQVRTWAPRRKEPIAMQFQIADGQVRFELPELRIYTVCEIRY